MQRAILSPHFDDAVLSCWHLLEGPCAVSVVNVFTASPPPGHAVPAWDRLTGATDSARQMQARREEDRRAIGLVGRDVITVDLLDHQYRDSPLPLDAVADRLEGVVPPATILHAPAAMTGHPDHLLVRDAALRMARDRWRVELYADLPHAIAHGWPAWVTSSPSDGAGEAWSQALAAAGLVVERLVPRVRPLDAATRKRKLRALAAYRSQRQALDRVAFAPLDQPGVLGWEVYWEIPRSALRSRDGSESGGEAVIVDARRKLLDDRFRGRA